jgi:catechol 2,3-dioxygenase-like lactoylglutathione lyase family enzyme
MARNGKGRATVAPRKPMAPRKLKGMPGMRGMDHIGLTVPDVDQAVEFFVKVLGFEEFYNLGTFSHPKGNWMKEYLNVHPRAKITNMRMIRCGAGPNIELFEYEAPGKRRRLPKNSDNGGHHFAIYVEDMERAVKHLKKHGVKILGAPTLNQNNAEHGEHWCYFLAPWGAQFELVSYPGGRAYEAWYTRRLWDARTPTA